MKLHVLIKETPSSHSQISFDVSDENNVYVEMKEEGEVRLGMSLPIAKARITYKKYSNGGYILVDETEAQYSILRMYQRHLRQLEESGSNDYDEMEDLSMAIENLIEMLDN